MPWKLHSRTWLWVSGREGSKGLRVTVGRVNKEPSRGLLALGQWQGGKQGLETTVGWVRRKGAAGCLACVPEQPADCLLS